MIKAEIQLLKRKMSGLSGRKCIRVYITPVYDNFTRTVPLGKISNPFPEQFL